MAGNADEFKQVVEEMFKRQDVAMELRLLQLEYRIVESVSKKTDTRIVDALGMSSDEHRQSHYGLKTISEAYNELSAKVTKGIISALLVLCMTVAYGASSLSREISLAIPPVFGRDTHSDKPIRIEPDKH